MSFFEFKKSDKGFTLIETILYLAIAGTVLYFISGFAFEAIFGKAKIESIQEINENNRSVLNEISRAVGNSLEINGLVSIDTSIIEEEEEFVSQIPTDGLISYWPFDGDALDAVGDNDGTLYGDTVLTTGVKGVTDTAYAFDGNGDYISLPTSLNNIEIFTIGGWFNTNDKTLSQRIFSLYKDNLNPISSKLTIIINGDVSGAIQYGHRLSDGSTWSGYVGATSILDDTWHFYTLSYNGTTFLFYLDGVLVHSRTASYTTLDGGAPLIGAHNIHNPSAFFNGTIDNTRFYSRALSADEIAIIYNEEKP